MVLVASGGQGFRPEPREQGAEEYGGYPEECGDGGNPITVLKRDDGECAHGGDHEHRRTL